MSEARVVTLSRILAFSAVVEIGTGIALLIAPAIGIPLLIRGEIADLVLVLTRAMGITLIGLGLACWPKWRMPGGVLPAWCGMLAYNGLITLLLGYAGSVLRLAGPLLWPTVLLHGVVALLLIWRREETGRTV